MTRYSLIPENSSGEELLAQLEKILASGRFQKALNEASFLRHVVATAISDAEPDTLLTEQLIAVHVFDKPSNFNPMEDSIVRAIANKLRDRLARYYREEGRHDLVVITIPKGAYVPKFEKKTVDLPSLLKILREACPPDSKTAAVMKRANRERFAIDKSMEILHSHDFQGWTEDKISVSIKPNFELPADLRELARKHEPPPPNNGKFRLSGLIEDTSERETLGVVLSRTDYFSVRPIEDRMFEPVIMDDGGRPCSPADKYGEDPTHVEACLLPNIVCLHIIVILPGDKGDRLLLTRRIKHRGTDWERGKWSATVDEQMNSGSSVRGPDRDFFATVEAGITEELGCTCDRKGIKILSISMDSLVFAIVVDAIVKLDVGIETIRAFWEFKARDGKAEIREVLDTEWSTDALIPVLCGEDLIIGDARIAVADWTLTSRMSIAVSLFHNYRLEPALLALRERFLSRTAKAPVPTATASASVRR